MNKTDFLEKLEKSLDNLNKKEKEKTISYYDEMIEDLKEDGLSEKDAIQKIGNPETIANTILAEVKPKTPKEITGKLKVLIIILLILGLPLWGSIVLAIIALLISLLLLIICGYIIIWCIPFTLAILSMASLILSVTSMIGALILMSQNVELGIFQLGLGVSLMGAFILLTFITIKISKHFINLTKKFSNAVKKYFGKIVEVKIWKN